jgi:O-antigen ligase
VSKFRPSATASSATRPPLVHAPVVQPAPISALPPTSKPALGPLTDYHESTISRIALFAAAGFIFVRYTFLHEIIAVTLGFRSFLPPLFGISAILGLLISGSIKRAIQERPIQFWIGFTAILFLGVPFSTWPGDSTGLMMGFLQNEFPVALFIAGLVTSWKNLKIILHTLAGAGIVNELTAIYMTRTSDPRLGGGVPTIANANDFAAQLLLLTPILGFFLLSKSISKFIRIIMLPVCVYAAYLILRSGSRGALVSMALLYVVLIIKARGMQRVGLGLAVPVIAAVVLMAMPGEVVERLRTVFGSDEQSTEVTSEALESTKGRRYLFTRSLELTGRHPLLGVGIGQFSTAEGFDAKAQGIRGLFMQPHNSYTQISSEAGVPALIMLLCSLVVGWRAVSRTLREARQYGKTEIEAAALAIMISIVAFCAAAFFLSLAYRFYFPTLIGLSVAVSTALKYELANSRQPVTVPAR